MPKLSFPKPPQFTRIMGENNPLRSALNDVRQTIIAGKEGITSIASAISLEGDAPHREPVEEKLNKNEPLDSGNETGKNATVYDTPIKREPPEGASTALAVAEAIKGGTAGTVCSEEHISQATSELKEALRMARARGIKDPEVRDRLHGARDELNSMERRDMVAEKIQGYPQEQQDIARWLLPKSAALRHSISEMLMKDATVEDLEKASAMAAKTSREFTQKIEGLPAAQKAGDECLGVKQLKQFVEERHLKEG
jgi:hypothetical protein